MSKSKVETIWFPPAIPVHNNTMKTSSFCISMTSVSILGTSYSKLGKFLPKSNLSKENFYLSLKWRFCFLNMNLKTETKFGNCKPEAKKLGERGKVTF